MELHKLLKCLHLHCGIDSVAPMTQGSPSRIFCDACQDWLSNYPPEKLARLVRDSGRWRPVFYSDGFSWSSEFQHLLPGPPGPSALQMLVRLVPQMKNGHLQQASAWLLKVGKGYQKKIKRCAAANCLRASSATNKHHTMYQGVTVKQELINLGKLELPGKGYRPHQLPLLPYSM